VQGTSLQCYREKRCHWRKACAMIHTTELHISTARLSLAEGPRAKVPDSYASAQPSRWPAASCTQAETHSAEDIPCKPLKACTAVVQQQPLQPQQHACSVHHTQLRTSLALP
jgi:hypothetical protein